MDNTEEKVFLRPDEIPGPIEIPYTQKGYAVLGIHGKDVKFVKGDFMRVRFFIGDKMIDEDLPIPVAKTFEQLVEEMLQKRYNELKAK